MRICPGSYVFVSIPKAGTHAIFNVLDKHFGPHVPNIWRHKLDVPKKYKDLFTFTTCRNPYTRAVSQWWTMVGMPSQASIRKTPQTPFPYGTNFDKFIRWLTSSVKAMDGANTQSHRYNRFRQDQILRIEILEQDFNTLPFVNEHIEVPLINQWGDTGKAPPQVYDQELADMVYDWAREDFERLGYHRDSWGY